MRRLLLSPVTISVSTLWLIALVTVLVLRRGRLGECVASCPAPTLTENIALLIAMALPPLLFVVGAALRRR